MALEALAQRRKLAKELSETFRQLGSGFKINRAEDDAAGWSISRKLNMRIATMSQALENVTQARSVLDIAESSLTSINSRLTEVKKLATQAANGGVYGAEELRFIRSSINAQARQIDAIVDQAQFNSINLLDGTYNAIFQVGEETPHTLNFVMDQNISTEDTQVSQVSTRGILTAAAPITLATQLNSLNQFEALQAGDSFDIEVTAGDGTVVSVAMVLAGTKGDLATETVGDLINAINFVPNITASLDAEGSIIVEEITPTDGNQLAVSFTNFVEATGLDGAVGTISLSFQAATGGFVSAFTSAGPIAGGTLLNDLDQFTDLEGNDTISVNLNARDGTSTTVNYTLPGGVGNPSTATLSSLAAAITAGGVGKFQANITGGQLLIEEINLAQNSLLVTTSFSEFSGGDAIRPAPPFTFAYSSESMSATLLDSLLNPATAATQINDLNGFSNIHGGDVIGFTLRNRAGVSQVFNFTFNDVGDGILSTLTVGDIVSFLDGQTVGGTQFNVSLSGAGELLIEEDNPPQAGFSASAVYTEDDLDITPKNFSAISFAISDFLPLSNDSGLVIGLGLESFNETYALTPEIARFLIRNVDDSLARINGILNDIGVFQTRLTNREDYLSRSIINNSTAKSRIEDADIARLQSRYIQQLIQQDYQSAAMTQANFAPRNLLQLLT